MRGLLKEESLKHGKNGIGNVMLFGMTKGL